MINKYITVILILFFAPCLLIAQTDATLSVKKGDDMFKETRYADALRYYYAALEYQEGEIPGLQTKIEKTEHCKILMDKILQANEYGRKEDEENYLRQLYKIHPSKLLKMKIDEFDQQRREQEKMKREQELKEQAEREAEKRRIQIEQEKQRQEEERRRIEECKQEEIRRWNDACKSNTINSYNAFINTFPQSQNKSEALRRIKDLEYAQKWEQTRRVNTVDAYQNFIDKYPDSKFVGIANQKISDITDEENWNAACRENTISAYQRYIDNDGKNNSVANFKIDIIKKQKRLISEASNLKNNKKAYEKIREARRLGELSQKDENTALKIEEPYAYQLAKSSDAGYSTMSDYIQKYNTVAPENHIKAITKKKNKVVSSRAKATATPTYTAKEKHYENKGKEQYSAKVTVNHTYTAKDNYYENNGQIQYTWFAAEGYIGTALGGTASIFEWRFGLVEIAPLTLGWHYIPNYSANWNSDILNYRLQSLYIQPTVRCYFPFSNSGDRAVYIGAALTMPETWWFMAEVGYNYNYGLLNGNLFFRYNGDFVVGFQLKICHVLGKK